MIREPVAAEDMHGIAPSGAKAELGAAVPPTLLAPANADLNVA